MEYYENELNEIAKCRKQDRSVLRPDAPEFRTDLSSLGILTYGLVIKITVKFSKRKLKIIFIC